MRSACLYVKIIEDIESFQHLEFETIFLKNQNFSLKLEHRFLARSTMNESATFTYETALS